MKYRVSGRDLVVALALLTATEGVAAQNKPLTISITGVTSDLPVSTVVNGVRQMAGIVPVASGTGQIRTDRLVGKGKRIDVKVDTRDGQEQLVLVDGTDPECEDTPRRDEEGCKPLGAFALDEVSSISITKGPTGTVFGSSPGGVIGLKPKKGTNGLYKPRTFSVGGQVGYTRFPNFQDQVGNQPGISTFRADQSPVLFGVTAMARPWEIPAGIELTGQVVIQDYTQTYQSGDQVTGQVKGYFLETNVYYFVPAGGSGTLGIGSGVSIAVDQLKAIDDATGPQGFSRTHTGLQFNARAFYGFPLGGGFGGRAGVGMSTGGAGDADYRLLGTLTFERQFGF